MKVKTYSGYSRMWLTVLLVGVLCAGLPPTNAAAQEGAASARLSVLESTPARTVVELTVPDYQLAQTDIEGRSYDLVQIPGTQQSQDAGRPQLPVIGTMLGMTSLSDLTVRVLEADYDTEAGLRVPAAMTPQVSGSGLSIEDGAEIREAYIEDAEVFASSEFYPAMPVDLGSSGMLREQAVTQLRFNPVQYNPVTGEARVYRRIIVEVVSEIPVVAAGRLEEPVNPDFERLLEHSLLNYGDLLRPPPTLAQAVAHEQQAQAAAADTGVSLKLAVEMDGIYKVNYSDLTGAGLNLAGVDPRKIQVRNRGAQVPILVRGEVDGKFDADDYVLFYGQAVNDIYTIRNVYWLSVGDTAGLRMATRDGTPGAAQVAAQISLDPARRGGHRLLAGDAQRERRGSLVLGYALDPNSSGIEISRTYTVTLDHISTTATSARLRVRLKGFTGLAHRTKIYLNDYLADDKTWNGQIIFDHDVAVPQNRLINGADRIKVETIDTGAIADQLLVNWIEIDYTDTYVAQPDRLAFRPPASGVSPYRYKLLGFSAGDIRVFDVTAPKTPVVLVNAAISSVGGFSAEFQDAGTLESRYLAVANGGYRRPPSSWIRRLHGSHPRRAPITSSSPIENSSPRPKHWRPIGKRKGCAPLQCR